MLHQAWELGSGNYITRAYFMSNKHVQEQLPYLTRTFPTSRHPYSAVYEAWIWSNLWQYNLSHASFTATKCLSTHHLPHSLHHSQTPMIWYLTSPHIIPLTFIILIFQNIRYCDDALELDPANPKAYFRRSAGYEAKKDYDKVRSLHTFIVYFLHMLLILTHWPSFSHWLRSLPYLFLEFLSLPPSLHIILTLPFHYQSSTEQLYF